MKAKRWVLWLLVLAFLASEVFLFSANRQKSAALNSLREAQQQAADLQSQLDQLKSANAGNESAELARLRAENLDLPRLRNQVTQLQLQNQKLSQQLQDTHSVAQQQQSQLQQLAVENQQAQAAAQQAGEEAARNTCINNLRQIDAAKQQWALENNKVGTAVPTAQDLLPYLKDGVFPTCPDGGTYTINAVDELPECSIPRHTLAQ